MKKGKVLIAVGTVILVFGIYVVAAAVLPADATDNVTIPAGEYYYVFSFGGIVDGEIAVDYLVADGTIDIYVFDSDQYAEYETTGSADHLYTTSGDSGSFSFVLPDSGTYYIVLEHGFLSSFLSQDVVFETTITGIALLGTGLGAVLMVAGIAMAVLGMRMKGRESAATPPPPQTDVTFFQGPPQSPPGQV